MVQKFVPRSVVGIFRNKRTRSTPLDPTLMFWCISYNFGAFGTVWLTYKTRCKTVLMVQKLVPRSRVGIFRNERTRSPHSTLKNVLVHFIKFWYIWVRLVDLQNSLQNWPNWCKSSCHEVALEFFAMNAPDAPHCILNSCFGAFVQFWCIWDCLVDLQNSVQNGPNRCKSSCHEVASDFFATNAPNPPHGTLNSCFGAFCKILVHLWPFGWLTKLNAKLAELVQKFVPRSGVGIFCNERTRSTPLDPKLMFWCISYNFCAFGTILLTYETRCKTGRTGTKVCGMKSHRNFSQRTHRIHPIGP